MAGTTYALVISVENYHQNHHLPKVKYANKDAKDFYDALINIGIYKDNIILLQDNLATKTTIVAELKEICSKAIKIDNIMFFFAGHGVYSDSQNYIAPIDTYKTDIKNTCVSINKILGIFKKSECQRNILFLDCCHSGFQPGDDTRELDTDFMADELLYHYSKEEYCIGFASCKSNQKSVSSDTLKNGVWSHHLIKALKGEAGNIYEEGLLFSDKLQSYLNKNVAPFVKMDTVDKKDQTPISFGSQTDRFPIANLNPIFQRKLAIKKAADIKLDDISLINIITGRVKSLPGFIKGRHWEPKSIDSYGDNYIKNVGNSLVDEEITSLSESLRKQFKYKRKEIEAYAEDGTGAINTPDFTYTLEIRQSDKSPDEYLLIRKLKHFKNSELVFTPEFNSIFSDFFNVLKFELQNEIDIEEIIDKIESLDIGDNIVLDFNPKDLDSFTLTVKGSNKRLKFTRNTISIRSSNKTSPDKLINAFRDSYKAIMSNPNLKMLK